jgi:ferredoxin
MPKLTFLKDNRSLQLKEGTELQRVPHIDATVPLKFGCCQGRCGTCAIKIAEGAQNLSPQTQQERNTLQQLGLSSHRLACQCALKGDVVIDD